MITIIIQVEEGNIFIKYIRLSTYKNAKVKTQRERERQKIDERAYNEDNDNNNEKHWAGK